MFYEVMEVCQMRVICVLEKLFFVLYILRCSYYEWKLIGKYFYY